MKEPEIKYTLPEIDININDDYQKNSSNAMNKFFQQLENIENIRNKSLIMTEISNSKINAASQIINSTLLIHQGIKCEKCQKSPIIGHRYKCPKCLNYNLCEECELLNSEVHFHPHLDFILCRIPETSITSNEYSYECLSKQLEIHEKEGVESFNIEIKIKNTGYLKWPEGKTILKCNKEKSTIFCNNCDFPSIDMNQEINVVVNFNKCNKIPKGKYICLINIIIEGKRRRGPIEIKVFIE